MFEKDILLDNQLAPTIAIIGAVSMGLAYSEAGLKVGLKQQCWLTGSSQPEKLATFSEHVHVHRSAEDMMNCNRWNSVISAVPTNNQYQTATSFSEETRPYIAEKPFLTLSSL